MPPPHRPITPEQQVLIDRFVDVHRKLVAANYYDLPLIEARMDAALIAHEADVAFSALASPVDISRQAVQQIYRKAVRRRELKRMASPAA